MSTFLINHVDEVLTHIFLDRYTTALSNYASFSYKQPLAYRFVVGLFLILLMAFITGYYHYIKDPAFHQNAFALLTAVVVFRSMYTMEINLRPSRRKGREHKHGQNGHTISASEAAEQARKDARDEKIVNTMWIMIAYGLSTFLGGFAIWALDNKYCSTIRAWRAQVGLPWGILLEGHGWW